MLPERVISRFMTLGKSITPRGSASKYIAAFLRPRWRSLTVITVISGLLAGTAGGILHWLFADAASTDLRGTVRWIVWTWLALAGPWWTVTILRALRPRRRTVLLSVLAMTLAVCVGWPAGTWWTYLVDHAAGKGAVRLGGGE